MKRGRIQKMVLAAMFLAMAFVLPFLTTGNNPILASSLSPIHIPVFLCGFVCGWEYAVVVGLLAPLLRFLMVHMPPTLYQALSMMGELATYGLVSGILFSVFRKKDLVAVYVSLITAMLAGRVVWGILRYTLVFAGLAQEPFTFQAFLTTGFVKAVPAFVLHLILVPAVVMALIRAGYLRKEERADEKTVS